MNRLSRSVFAGLVSFALAVPALAQPSSFDLPSCGEGKDHDKKDEKKNPSSAEPSCGEGKDHDKKDKKDPATAEPNCGEGKDHDKKDEKKDPAVL
jgi:hypothetical protein